tara:strand:+ start:104 stop:325 length:222 start_codon:yes stop_codon:yes gene_type:complete
MNYQAYNPNPDVPEEFEPPSPPQERVATHRVILLGRERFRGTHTECSDFISKGNDAPTEEVAGRWFSYKVEEI